MTKHRVHSTTSCYENGEVVEHGYIYFGERCASTRRTFYPVKKDGPINWVSIYNNEIEEWSVSKEVMSAISGYYNYGVDPSIPIPQNTIFLGERRNSKEVETFIHIYDSAHLKRICSFYGGSYPIPNDIEYLLDNDPQKIRFKSYEFTTLAPQATTKKLEISENGIIQNADDIFVSHWISLIPCGIIGNRIRFYTTVRDEDDPNARINKDGQPEVMGEKLYFDDQPSFIFDDGEIPDYDINDFIDRKRDFL